MRPGQYCLNKGCGTGLGEEMGVTIGIPGNIVVNRITATAIRDAILSLPDGDRKIIISRPSSGQREVTAIQRAANGKIINECLDTPES